MKRIYIAESLIDGQLVVDLLDHAGIPSLLFHQNAMGGFGELPVTHPEVWVRHDRDAATAHRLVEDFEHRPAPPDDRPCGTCGEANPTTFELCWRCDAPL